MNILSKSLESQKRALTLEKCKRKARMIAYKISINNDRCKEDDGNYRVSDPSCHPKISLCARIQKKTES